MKDDSSQPIQKVPAGIQTMLSTSLDGLFWAALLCCALAPARRRPEQRSAQHTIAMIRLVALPDLLNVGPVRIHLLDKLFFDRLHIEACPFLHRRELKETLRNLANFSLSIDETPELVGEPVIVAQRSVLAAKYTGAFERVEPEIRQDRPIDFL